MCLVPIMPQDFQVLQCYSCQTFQVHQVKKTAKWSCKMCGEKQSLKKVFGRGTGAECRQHVQRLNTMRGELVQSTLNTSDAEGEGRSSEGLQINVDDGEAGEYIGRNPPNMQNYENTKWNVFVESDDVNDDHSDDDDDDSIYTTDAQQFKSGRKRKRESKGGNPSASSSTKWSEFSNTTDAESHDNVGRDSMERNRACYSISRNNYDLKSRMKWNTFGANKSSSLESLSGGIDTELHDLGSIDSLERNGTRDPTSRTNHEVQRMDSTGYIIQERKFQGKYSNTFGHCAHKRTKWNTFGANEPSSLESLVGLTETQLNTFQTAPCFQEIDTILDKRQNCRSTGTINLPKNRYSVFTESDLSSQESHEGELEEDAHDSRPYLTFDPEKMRNLGGSEKFNSSAAAAESSNLAVDTGTVSDHRDKKTSVSSSSKWMSFVTYQKSQYGQNSVQPAQTFGQNSAQEYQCIQSPEQENQCGQNSEQENQCGQNSEQENQCGQNSEQEYKCGQSFINHEADLDFDEAKENSPPCLSFIEGEEGNKSCHLMQNKATIIQCSETSNRGCMASVVRIKSGSNEQKIVLKNIEEMKPVFTAGDLEDSDFEL